MELWRAIAHEAHLDSVGGAGFMCDANAAHIQGKGLRRALMGAYSPATEMAEGCRCYASVVEPITRSANLSGFGVSSTTAGVLLPSV